MYNKFNSSNRTIKIYIVKHMILNFVVESFELNSIELKLAGKLMIN